jgi:hypothetical protein
MKRLTFFLLIVAILAIISSCRTVRVVEQVPVEIHDTNFIERVRVDSIIVDRWQVRETKGDTVRERDSVLVRLVSHKRDTIREIQEKPVEVEKVIEVERKQTKLHKIMIGSGVALWLVVFIVATGIILRKLERK